MKRGILFFWLIVLIFSFSLTGCGGGGGSDRELSPYIDPEILGHWELTSCEVKLEDGTTVMADVLPHEYTDGDKVKEYRGTISFHDNELYTLHAWDLSTVTPVLRESPALGESPYTLQTPGLFTDLEIAIQYLCQDNFVTLSRTDSSKDVRKYKREGSQLIIWDKNGELRRYFKQIKSLV